jgi:ABC-2 type transport system permease protein
MTSILDRPAGDSAKLAAAGTPPAGSARVGTAGNELRAVRVLWRRELVRLVRNRAQIALMLLNPVLFLLVLGTGLDTMVAGASGVADYRAYLFPGVLLMAVQMPALSAGMSIVRDREAGFLRGLLVAPVGRATILVGKCLGGATAAALQGGLLLAFAGFVGIPYHPGLLALLLGELALIAFTMTGISALAAVFVNRMETFQTTLSLGMMPLFFLSGALFTVTGLPKWLGFLTLANPLSYAVDALRRTASQALPAEQMPAGPVLGGWTPPVGLELAAMVVVSLLALTGAARRFARTA